MRLFKITFPFLALSFLISCKETPKTITTDSVISVPTEIIDTVFNNGIVDNDTVHVPTQHLQIGTSGLFIDLPITHKLEEQKGTDFLVYYFTPVDTTIYHGEGGIYFGPKPDMHPPHTAYTQKTITGKFLEQTTKWTEYTTNEYMQTETFIDNGDGQKIHVWFYANNPIEMARLLKMVKTIARK